MSYTRGPKKNSEFKEVKEQNESSSDVSTSSTTKNGLASSSSTSKKSVLSGPVKIRPFDQSALIKSSRSFFRKKTDYMDLTGICGGLVNLWCEYVATGRDLISEINNVGILGLFSSNPGLARRINLSQEKSNITRPVLIPLKNGLPAKSFEDKDLADDVRTSLEDKGQHILYADEARLANLGYSDAIVIPNLSIDLLADHLDKLHITHRSESGLHTIMSDNYFSNGLGHLISWTYNKAEEQYVLFDPNHGEYFFNDFASFKNYLCRNHLPNLYNSDKMRENFPGSYHRSPLQLLSVADYYSTEPTLKIKK